MDRAQELFERILRQGVPAIQAFIDDQKAEELFLDFKRSSDDGRGTKLSNNDRNNLGRAISGFANSEGGVIVWGVNCSRGADGTDVATGFAPIVNPRRFASWIQGVISGCTIPPHTGVRAEALEIERDQGFAITLVPKSDAAPHQAASTKHYYIRAGSSFVPTPHDVLAGMFGRRPQPHVFPHFTLAAPELKGGELVISFGLAIHNEGPGIAADVFAIYRIEAVPGQACSVELEEPNTNAWTGYWEFKSQLSLIGAPDRRLPPGANVQPTVAHLHLAPPFQGELRFTMRVGASGARQYRYTIQQSAEVIDREFHRFLDLNSRGVFPREIKMQIAEAMLTGQPVES